MQKVIAEDTQASQIIHIFIGKVQIFDIFYDLFQPGHDRIAAFIRIITEKHIKNNSFVFLGFKVALHHSQFIQVGQQCEILCTHNISLFSFAVRPVRAAISTYLPCRSGVVQ